MSQNRDNVYEGAPDERQSCDPALRPSRFRPRYRALSAEEKPMHDAIKAKAEELETMIQGIWSGPTADIVADREATAARGAIVGRYKSLAVTSLEEAIMWAIKGLTS